MRAAALCLLLTLAACSTTRQASKGQSTPTDAPRESAPQAAATPAPGSSVPLSVWNASERRQEIRLVDPATGQEVPGYPPISAGGPFAFSSDGRKVAIHETRGQSCEPFAGGSACHGGAGILHLIALPAWHEAMATLPAKGWVGPIAFNPNAARLALVANERESSTLMLLDATSGKIVAQRELNRGFRPSLLAFRRDGTAVVAYGQPTGTDPGVSRPNPPRALLIDATTLDIIWDEALPSVLSGQWCLENCNAPHEQVLFASWTPAVIASSEGSKLFIIHADADRLTTVDLEARSVRTVEIRAAQSWLDRLLGLVVEVAEAKGGTRGGLKAAALSPDGTQLYVVGHTTDATLNTRGAWEPRLASLGLQVIQVEDGRRITSHDLAGTVATRIGLTSDGAHVLLHGYGHGEPWTEVLDAKSLRRVAHLTEEVVSAQRISGEPVVLSSQPGQQSSRLALLDAGSFDIVHSWAVNSRASWLAIAS